jgi:hypothetical protein
MSLQAVLAGGAVFGVLSALPVVDTCCCLWMVCGGMAAAYLTQQGRPEPIQLGDGALAGLLAGVAGAVIYAVTSLPVQFVTAPIRRRLVEGLIDSAAELPPELRQFLDGFGADGGVGSLFLGLVLMFPLMLILGSIFSTLGGLLGALIFRSTPKALPAAPVS